MSRLRPFTLLLAGSGLLLGALLLLPIFALLLTSKPADLFRLLGDAGARQALGVTLLSSLLALPPTLLLGLPAAYGLSRCRGRLRRSLEMLLELPMVLPPVVAGLALLLAFGRRGLLGALLADLGVRIPFTLSAVVIAILFIVTPFFVRRSALLFDGVARQLEDAARLLGATPWQSFRHVALPVARRGLFAEGIISLAQGFGLFGAVVLFAGNLPGHTQTLSLAIYSAFEADPRQAFTMGSMLLLISLLLLAAARIIQPREGEDERS